LAQDRIRQIAKKEFHDPAEVLRHFRSIELEMARHREAGTIDMPHKAHALRTNDLKNSREMRQAALFCYGMSVAINKPVLFSPEERDDYDFVASWFDGDAQHFAPVQLKELVPEHLNSRQTFEALLEKAKQKYTNSDDLTLAIYLNRVGRFDPGEVRIDRDLKLAGIWAFGGTSPDQSKFGLWGDLLHDEPCLGIEFEYPKSLGIVF
jgi:hypothetical protein|tara:strand:- start:326 stop:946 length:621 start_codon:yes stop_codon:yes gene_type:complete